jgi:hypothetical protein
MAMPKTKVARSLDTQLSDRVDGLVAHRTRLARECAKLEPKEEKAFAEEGFSASAETWPEY